MNLTLLIMAAGLGSRFGGLKQLHPFGSEGEVLLDYAIFDALQAGFNHFVFIIRPEIEEDFDSLILARLPSSVSYSIAYQTLENIPYFPSIPFKRQKPWGTAHAIWTARHLLTTPFAAINGDDFYGHNTFKKLAQFLQTLPPSPHHQACVTFPLRKTLSPYGSVCRGVCKLNDKQEMLSITECTQISLDAQGTIYQTLPSNKTFTFTGNENVSVNCWAFWPSFLEFLEPAVIDFFKKPSLSEKEECLLPEVINDLIQEQKIVIQAIQSDNDWAGVTYREDVEWVEHIISKYTQEGLYPKSLWENYALKS